MDIQAFFKKVEAEFVGGRVKAVVDGVHHWIAHFIDGNIVLTAAGHEILANLEGTAPHLMAQIENVPGAVTEIGQIAANPASIVGGIGAQTAADAVDAAFANLGLPAKKTAKTKAAPKVDAPAPDAPKE